MIEIADHKPQKKLEMEAYVYKHICHLYDNYYKNIFGKLDGILMGLKFNDTMTEFIRIAQMDKGKYLKDYYERLKKNAI